MICPMSPGRKRTLVASAVWGVVVVSSAAWLWSQREPVAYKGSVTYSTAGVLDHGPAVYSTRSSALIALGSIVVGLVGLAIIWQRSSRRASPPSN